MTAAENTPQITTLADVPIEFWIAMGIQIFITVFAIWAVVKFLKFVINLSSRVAKTTPAADPTPESIDDDFADIEAAMKAEK